MNNGWVAKKELVDKVMGHLNEHPAGQKHVSELTEKEVRGKIWKHLRDTAQNLALYHRPDSGPMRELRPMSELSGKQQPEALCLTEHG